MLFIKEKTSLDNRVWRFAITLLLVVIIYFAIGIIEDILVFLGK